MSDLEMRQADGTWKKIGTVDPKTVQALEAELFQTEIPGNLAEGETVQEFHTPAPKHTPGPWREHDQFRNDLEGVNGALVAGVYGPGRLHPDEVRANARLIAQAPTLLAYLTEAAQVVRQYERLHRAQGEETIADVNAALAARFEATIAAAVGGAE